MSKDVMPRTEDGRKSWGDNMLLKFPPISSSVGFHAADTAAFLGDVTTMIFVIDSSQSAQAESKAWTAFKNQMLEGVADGAIELPIPITTAPAVPAEMKGAGLIPRIRAAIAQIKTASGYTDAIGEQLRIVGDGADDLNPAEGKPGFKALPKFGSVILDWKKGDFDGVVIESMRGTETSFSFLDKDYKSPFPDMRPNLVAGVPEVRRYRMIYLLDDQVVGVWSDEVVITTMA